MTKRRLPFPLNPDYGLGAVRRRVTLEGGQGVVRGHVYDNFHEMRCVIDHRDGRVTAIAGEVIRFPTSACPAAVEALRTLVGWPLATSPNDLAGDGRQRANCTHLFDLAVLAMRHAARGSARRVYDAVVPDEGSAPTTAEVSCDGAVVHRWQIADDHIVAPAPLAGRPLRAGFGAWAAAAFEGAALDAALVLDRACFLTTGRRYRTEAGLTDASAMSRAMTGACYAYAPERAGTTRFVGDNVRDLSAGIPSGG